MEDSMLALAERMGVRHVWGVSSGRAALCVVLSSLRQLRPERAVVALPAYTCFSVAAAIVRSGLTLYPLDINPETLDFDPLELEKLPDKTLLCIITSNLFGYAGDIVPVHFVAHQKGAFVVDNAAQALGSLRDGQLAGTRGDVGVFSLGRGKPISAIEGGLIVANADDISQAVAQEVNRLRPKSPTHTVYMLLQLGVYAALLHPTRYWIPNAIPFLQLGTTTFEPTFPVHTLHTLARHLLLAQWDRLGALNEIRRSNAARITGGLGTSDIFYFPQPASSAQPAMVRLPVLAAHETTRQLAVSRLRGAGVGATCFYPSAICDIPGIQQFIAAPNYHCTKAECLSRTLFTLPVHPLVEQGDINRIIAILRAVEQDNAYRTASQEYPSPKVAQ